MEYKICTDKLPAAATVHACHYKGFSCSNYKANVNANIVYLLIPNMSQIVYYTEEYAPVYYAWLCAEWILSAYKVQYPYST